MVTFLLYLYAVYAIVGYVLFCFSSSIYEDATWWDDVKDFFFYITLWPIELYRMIKYNPNEITWEDED